MECLHNRKWKRCRECRDPKIVFVNNWVSRYRIVDKRANLYDEKEYIDKPFLLELFKKSEGKCCYCKIEMDLINYGKSMVSLERLSNTKGHIKSNVILSCFGCNCKRVGQKEEIPDRTEKKATNEQQKKEEDEKKKKLIQENENKYFNLIKPFFKKNEYRKKEFYEVIGELNKLFNLNRVIYSTYGNQKFKSLTTEKKHYFFIKKCFHTAGISIFTKGGKIPWVTLRLKFV